jgi:hypothetical protein
MLPPTYKGKRIIHEGRTSNMVQVAGCLLVSVGALVVVVVKGGPSDKGVWVGIVVFGCIGIWLLMRLLNPNNLFVKPKSALEKEIEEAWKLEKWDAHGAFIYTSNGFIFTKEGAADVAAAWTNIATVFGYQVSSEDERYQHVTLQMDIYLDNNVSFTASDYMRGWSAFIDKLGRQITIAPTNWQEKVLLPRFETNRILLFDKQGRRQEEAEAMCYKK